MSPHSIRPPILWLSDLPVDFHNPEPRYKMGGLRSAGHRVVVVDQIGVKNPHPRNLRKVIRYGRRLVSGSTNAGPSPSRQLVLLPPRHYAATDAVNDRLIRRRLRSVLSSFGGDGAILWYRFPSPELVRQLGHLDERLVVYDCVDRYAAFGYPPRATRALVAAEERLLARADLTLVTSRGLLRFVEPLTRNPVLHHSGVDVELFGRRRPVPSDLAGLPRPILGYTGAIDERVDLDLLARVAQRHPRGSVVIVGGRAPGIDAARLMARPNVHVLGTRPHRQLPGYVQAFDVGLLPYVRTIATDDVFPVKSLEYLAAGLPCVATHLPELRRFATVMTVAEDADAFVAGVEHALAGGAPDGAAIRSAASTFDWARRSEVLAGIVERTLAAH